MTRHPSCRPWRSMPCGSGPPCAICWIMLSRTPTRAARITLTATASAEAVTLSVADTGIGIRKSIFRTSLTSSFIFRGQSQEVGTGLGLAIVHEIVVAHGGTIVCESQPGTGTTFRLGLPIATKAAPSSYLVRHVGRKARAASVRSECKHEWKRKPAQPRSNRLVSSLQANELEGQRRPAVFVDVVSLAPAVEPALRYCILAESGARCHPPTAVRPGKPKALWPVGF